MKAHSTVADIFLASVASHPEQLAMHVTDDNGKGKAITYASLFSMACLACGGYKSRGVHSGDRIILALPASSDFYAAYIGAWFCGIIPLVVPPLIPGRINDVSSLTQLIGKTGSMLVVTPGACTGVPDNGCAFVTPEELMNNFSLSPERVRPDAVAHLQCTSGSTASQRLVIVRHCNILANVMGIGKAIKHRSTDKLVSWLPLFHDMGLIGLSYSLGWKCPFISTTTSRFVRNPYIWFQMISDHSGTLSPAPNSAFLACARLNTLRPPSGIDLSSWRVALCGSEPVQEPTVSGFSLAFGPFGYRPETMLPVYGLAEATLAATIPDPAALPHIEYIDSGVLMREGRAVATANAVLSTSDSGMVALGSALPDHTIRIVDEDGNTMPEGSVGEVQLSGPSVTDGYWPDEEGSPEIKCADGFLRTGDLGFLLEGQLYISGRKKDIIIIGGRNFSPLFIENIVFICLSHWVIRTIVAIGIPDSRSGTEQLHLLLDARPPDSSCGKPDAEDEIRQTLLEKAGIRGVTIHWMSRDRIPHTTSGKVQRYLCKQLIQNSIS